MDFQSVVGSLSGRTNHNHRSTPAFSAQRYFHLRKDCVPVSTFFSYQFASAFCLPSSTVTKRHCTTLQVCSCNSSSSRCSSFSPHRLQTHRVRLVSLPLQPHRLWLPLRSPHDDGSGDLSFLPGLSSGPAAVAPLHILPRTSLFSLTNSGPGGTVRGSNYRTDVTDKKPCKANILLYARATFESPGNVPQLIGQNFTRGIETAAPGRFLYQGIDYVIGIVPGQDQSYYAIRQLKGAVTLCPNATILLSGYSDGAKFLHRAVNITDIDKSKIGVNDPFQLPSLILWQRQR